MTAITNNGKQRKTNIIFALHNVSYILLCLNSQKEIKIMRKIFILAIFGITSISAFGRIGDTYQQSVKRFGKPIKYFKDKYAEIGLFEKLNYAILVKYNNGISYEETYAKLIPTALEFLRYKTSIRENKDFFSTEKYFTPLTKQQIEALLKANYNTSWSMTNKSQEECYYQAKSNSSWKRRILPVNEQ